MSKTKIITNPELCDKSVPWYFSNYGTKTMVNVLSFVTKNRTPWVSYETYVEGNEEENETTEIFNFTKNRKKLLLGDIQKEDRNVERVLGEKNDGNVSGGKLSFRGKFPDSITKNIESYVGISSNECEKDNDSDKTFIHPGDIWKVSLQFLFENLRGEQFRSGPRLPSRTNGSEPRSSQTSVDELPAPSQTSGGELSAPSQTSGGELPTPSQTTGGELPTPSQTTGGDLSSQRKKSDRSDNGLFRKSESIFAYFLLNFYFHVFIYTIFVRRTSERKILKQKVLKQQFFYRNVLRKYNKFIPSRFNYRLLFQNFFTKCKRTEILSSFEFFQNDKYEFSYEINKNNFVISNTFGKIDFETGDVRSTDLFGFTNVSDKENFQPCQIRSSVRKGVSAGFLEPLNPALRCIPSGAAFSRVVPEMGRFISIRRGIVWVEHPILSRCCAQVELYSIPKNFREAITFSVGVGGGVRVNMENDCLHFRVYGFSEKGIDVDKALKNEEKKSETSTRNRINLTPFVQREEYDVKSVVSCDLNFVYGNIFNVEKVVCEMKPVNSEVPFQETLYNITELFNKVKDKVKDKNRIEFFSGLLNQIGCHHRWQRKKFWKIPKVWIMKSVGTHDNIDKSKVVLVREDKLDKFLLYINEYYVCDVIKKDYDGASLLENNPYESAGSEESVFKKKEVAFQPKIRKKEKRKNVFEYSKFRGPKWGKLDIPEKVLLKKRIPNKKLRKKIEKRFNRTVFWLASFFKHIFITERIELPSLDIAVEEKILGLKKVIKSDGSIIDYDGEVEKDRKWLTDYFNKLFLNISNSHYRLLVDIQDWVPLSSIYYKLRKYLKENREMFKIISFIEKNKDGEDVPRHGGIVVDTIEIMKRFFEVNPENLVDCLNETKSQLEHLRSCVPSIFEEDSPIKEKRKVNIYRSETTTTDGEKMWCCDATLAVGIKHDGAESFYNRRKLDGFTDRRCFEFGSWVFLDQKNNQAISKYMTYFLIFADLTSEKFGMVGENLSLKMKELLKTTFRCTLPFIYSQNVEPCCEGDMEVKINFCENICLDQKAFKFYLHKNNGSFSPRVYIVKENKCKPYFRKNIPGMARDDPFVDEMKDVPQRQTPSQTNGNDSSEMDDIPFSLFTPSQTNGKERKMDVDDTSTSPTFFKDGETHYGEEIIDIGDDSMRKSFTQPPSQTTDYGNAKSFMDFPSEEYVLPFRDLYLCSYNVHLLEQNPRRIDLKIPYEFNAQYRFLNNLCSITDMETDNLHGIISLCRWFLEFFERFVRLFISTRVLKDEALKSFYQFFIEKKVYKFENIFGEMGPSEVKYNYEGKFHKSRNRNTIQAMKYKILFNGDFIGEFFQMLRTFLVDMDDMSVLKESENVLLIVFQNVKNFCDVLMRDSNRVLGETDIKRTAMYFDHVYIFVAHAIQIVGYHSIYILDWLSTLCVDLFYKRSLSRNGMTTQEFLNKIIRRIINGNTSKFKKLGMWKVQFEDFDDKLQDLDNFSNTALQTILPLLSKTVNPFVGKSKISIEVSREETEFPKDEMEDSRKFTHLHKQHALFNLSSNSITEDDCSTNKYLGFLKHFYNRVNKWFSKICDLKLNRQQTISLHNPTNYEIENTFKKYQLDMVTELVKRYNKSTAPRNVLLSWYPGVGKSRPIMNFATALVNTLGKKICIIAAPSNMVKEWKSKFHQNDDVFSISNHVVQITSVKMFLNHNKKFQNMRKGKILIVSYDVLRSFVHETSKNSADWKLFFSSIEGMFYDELHMKIQGTNQNSYFNFLTALKRKLVPSCIHVAITGSPYRNYGNSFLNMCSFLTGKEVDRSLQNRVKKMLETNNFLSLKPVLEELHGLINGYVFVRYPDLKPNLYNIILPILPTKKQKESFKDLLNATNDYDFHRISLGPEFYSPDDWKEKKNREFPFNEKEIDSDKYDMLVNFLECVYDNRVDENFLSLSTQGEEEEIQSPSQTNSREFTLPSQTNSREFTLPSQTNAREFTLPSQTDAREFTLPSQTTGDVIDEPYVEEEGGVSSRSKIPNNCFEKIIIFSNYPSLLKQLKYLICRDSDKIKSHHFFSITGEESVSQRIKKKELFEHAGFAIALVSTQVGGVGLTFISSRFMIILDPQWDHVWNFQSQFRQYRIGQRRDVYVLQFLLHDFLEDNPKNDVCSAFWNSLSKGSNKGQGTIFKHSLLKDYISRCIMGGLCDVHSIDCEELDENSLVFSFLKFMEADYFSYAEIIRFLRARFSSRKLLGKRKFNGDREQEPPSKRQKEKDEDEMTD